MTLRKIITGRLTPVIISPPTSYYNYRYRCIITDPIGQDINQVFILKFSTTWLGGVDVVWENLDNWSCGAIPDGNTDVIIPGNAVNTPEINSNAICRSISVKTSSVIIKSGFRLDVTGKTQ